MTEYRSAWDPEMKGEWRRFTKMMIPFFIVLTCLLWICLSIFWGSTYLLEYYFYRLNIFVVDFDSQASGTQALVGPTVVQELRMINQKITPHLTYQVLPPEHFPGGYNEVMEQVGHNKAWGAVVIFANATTSWRQAIQNGNAQYDPSGSVGLFYSGAHFYQIILLYVVPIMKENIQGALAMASDMAIRTFIQTAVTARNATALATAARAPSTIGIAFGFFAYDVRPITRWASAAPMEAGLIYNVIFTFFLVQISTIARLSTGLQQKLSTASLLKLRLAVPAFCYFWFALWYACVVRAFQVPLDASVGRAGFVVFWMLNYVTFLAIGLALEATMSLLTPRWFPFSLICWIILNITSSFLPIELMQPFYRWGRAWPFRLNVQASKLIFYNTEPRSHLGMYFGGLMAWAFAGVVSVTVFQLLDRWRGDRAQRQGIAAKKQQEREPREDSQDKHDEQRPGLTHRNETGQTVYTDARSSNEEDESDPPHRSSSSNEVATAM